MFITTAEAKRRKMLRFGDFNRCLPYLFIFVIVFVIVYYAGKGRQTENELQSVL